jgi:signal transduction histidine kinase
MAFASHHGYQRGIKAHLSRLDKEQQELIFPLSYSGTFKAYNIPPGEYQILFTNQGYHPAVRNTTVRANSVTKIPPVTLERAMGSDYFYHFVHTLNLFALAILLTTGIGTYYLRKSDRVGKAFLRFCLIMSFWSLWGIVSYVLEPFGKKEIGGHLTYLSLWAYSFIGVAYCHLFAVFPQPIMGEKTNRFLGWLYFPAVMLFPVEFIRVLFWYRPDYSRFLGFPQQITDAIIMAFFIFYLVSGNALLLVNLRRVKEKVQKIQLFFLFIAACFPPALFIGTMGAMYLFGLDYFFDNDMLFLSSLCDIIVPVFFGYGFVMFEHLHTIEKMAQQERLAFIGLMDAQLTHDIHSPIVVIGNLTDIVLKQIQKDNKEDAIRLTKEILKNADETLKLIASIKAELKKDKPQCSEAKIEEMVESAIQIIKRLTIKNIDIKKRESFNLPTICVEKTRFVYVLVNLLQNAVDSFDDAHFLRVAPSFGSPDFPAQKRKTPSSPPKEESEKKVYRNKGANRKAKPKVSEVNRKTKSKVREANTIEITGFAKDSKITLEIKDNGCGIPDDEKEKIFSGFHSTKEDNTGLGLFFAKNEIQRYGGDITCLSELSVGTTMIITLPIKHNAEENNSDNQTGIFKRFKDYAKASLRRALRSFLRSRQS